MIRCNKMGEKSPFRVLFFTINHSEVILYSQVLQNLNFTPHTALTSSFSHLNPLQHGVNSRRHRSRGDLCLHAHLGPHNHCSGAPWLSKAAWMDLSCNIQHCSHKRRNFRNPEIS